MFCRPGIPERRGFSTSCGRPAKRSAPKMIALFLDRWAAEFAIG